MTPIEEVRAALPPWASFANLLAWGAASFLLTAASTGAGVAYALRPLRRLQRSGRAAELSWVEQARVAYPARPVTGPGMLVAVVVLATAAEELPGTVSAVPRPAVWLAMCTAGLAALLLVGRRRRGAIVGQRPPWATALRDFVAIAVLARGLAIILGLLALSLAAADRRATVWVLIGAAAVASSLFALRGGLPLLRLLGMARPAGQRLRDAVERAAQRLGMAAPAAFEVTCTTANAFALVYARQVAFTSGLLALLDDAELTTVAAHELAHLREPLSVRLLRLAGLPLMLLCGGAVVMAGDDGWWLAIVSLLALVLLLVAVRRMARRMEARADASGRDVEVDAGGYAVALEKLYRVNLFPAVLGSRRATHPDLYDRLIAAGVQPSYPRPARPDRRRVWTALLLEALAAVTLAAALFLGLPAAILATAGPEKGLVALAGLTGGDPYSLSSLSQQWLRQRRVEPAIAAARVLAAAKPRDPRYASFLIEMLADAGQCPAAAATLAETEKVLARSGGPEALAALEDARDAVTTTCRH